MLQLLIIVVIMKSLAILSFGLLVLGASAFHIVVDEAKQDLDWWKTSVIYQIYPRSFKDSNGDGIGDLNGITSKLEHIKEAGADALWLSPIYSSPQKDFGYDISNFTDIAPEFGTLKDFDKLVTKAKSLGLKVMLDFVPNHSSHEHVWFNKSVNRVKPYDDYYIWRDAKKGPNGERRPPNNWLSVFGGSAWEWNEKRQQYFYHAFVVGQPDLNYRNPDLRKEMENVLTFWMDRGVDGFRVDAVNHMFEDPALRDEPKSSNDVPPDDYESLDHIYTRDLDDTYTVVKSWQVLLDNYVKNHKTDGKLQILEAYTSIPKSMKFYDVGANPFNFMFIANLNNGSSASDFKRTIDGWLNAIPEGKVANWVVGNHDNHRVASRYGFNNNRADQISLLSGILPGIAVVYNGDEIGMVDRPFTFAETVDPAGCQAGPQRYHIKSRDPERTPFQWDATTSAGFSNSTKTWLPVHSNYKTVNLAAQKVATKSHYKIFQALTKLKKTPTLQKGTVEVLLATEKVLAIVRRLANNPTVALLINFDNKPVTMDARTWLNIDEKKKIQIASLKSGLNFGATVDTTRLVLPGAASVILS
ncbi:alpha-glucosidase-like [Nasonia vitripennis]|uniref:alpha-glucosidase n=1 Tax=Nasonia vitripennis TaxID=7425 RepID=A0A7M6URF2_NASVI|nr:alpha-glucosidase-like [Nasonia vitripennis]